MSATAISKPNGSATKVFLKKILLLGGIFSSMLYCAMLVFIPMLYEGYSSLSYTVSEISAIDSPTRQLWMICVSFYTLLLVAFGWGVVISANGRRAMRVVGILMIVHGLLGIFWPPMHQRVVLAAGGGTMSDTLHIVWTMITVPMMLLEIGFGASVFGKQFRMYSIATIIILIVFGVLTGIDSPNMEANLPTPWMGVWERINIVGFMLWVAVFATMILRKQNEQVSKNETN